MTANMTVNVAKKDNVIAIPARAVIEENGQDIVRVITDTKNKTYKSVPVVTGLRADGGLIEIVTGITDGQEIVTFIR
jgi:multidrug efflux pump subunit AcrA (membrane-fusion protein)